MTVDGAGREPGQAPVPARDPDPGATPATVGPGGAPARPQRPGSATARGRWAWRDRPGLLWLLAVVVVAIVHRFVPGSRWLMVHMLLLGAATHSILVWSRHFADALLKTRPDPDARRIQTQRLAALHLGVLLVVLGVPTQVWPLTLLGAMLVGGAVAWHGIELADLMRRALPSRFGYTVRYYLAASVILPIGVTLGAWLARGADEATQARLLVAHLCLNVLGWIGLHVLGTLSTLWATMLRTRLPDGAERIAQRALSILLAGVALAASGPLVDQRLVSAVGVLVYLGGALTLGWGFARTAWRKRPQHFSTWSVGAGLLWLVGGLTWLVVDLVWAPSWIAVHDEIGPVTTVLAVGFVAQVLLGALSYLMPVVLGGGPAHLRAGLAMMGRGGALRVVATNLGLLLCLLPAPSAIKVTCSVAVLACLAAAIPLMLATIRQSIAARRSGTAPVERRAPRPGRQALVGVGLVAAMVAAGVAVDPTAAGLVRSGAGAAAAAVTPTGRTTQVTVTMIGMRFEPNVVDVPVGDRLVLQVVNADPEQVHDLVVETGVTSGRLGPGERKDVDVGVVGGDLDAWCSVAGHRQMGMTMQIRATGAAAGGVTEATQGAHGSHGSGDITATDGSGATAPAARRDPNATPPESFRARDAALPALAPARAGAARTPTVHRIALPVTEQVQEVAPGVRQMRWTFGGTAPGPVLHGRVGDVFEVTLSNTGTIGHSIDFHAGALAPDRPMRTIPPGQSLTYRFTATKAGVWMYHCSTMPMSLHIANGMFGAVVIEPDDLPAVDRSYVLVQSELYLGAVDGDADPAKVSGERPDLLAFNGYADQYAFRPLTARVGERVRLWVLAAGPNRGSAFHIVGGQFDTVYLEGAYRLRPDASSGGSQTLGLAPSQGGFVELTFPEPGSYPFVTHAMVDAERGARGLVRVTR